MTGSETQKLEIDMNGTISEVLALINDELLKRRVLVCTELAAGLPLVFGDRVQVRSASSAGILAARHIVRPATQPFREAPAGPRERKDHRR
jgi:hypothetical protein